MKLNMTTKWNKSGINVANLPVHWHFTVYILLLQLQLGALDSPHRRLGEFGSATIGLTRLHSWAAAQARVTVLGCICLHSTHVSNTIRCHPYRGNRPTSTAHFHWLGFGCTCVCLLLPCVWRLRNGASSYFRVRHDSWWLKVVIIGH